MPVWLSGLAAAVVIVGFLGAAVVFLRGSKDKGTIDTLERSNHALTERVSVLESSETRLTARVSALEKENVALAAQRPSAEVLTEIQKELRVYVKDARNANAETKALLMAIARIIEPRAE